MQRNRRNIFVRPVLCHKAFFHRILTARKSNLSDTHLLQTLGNSHCRENVATRATANKEELFHIELLLVLKFINRLVSNESVLLI